MAKESIKIIGINPGTRYLGIAILSGQDLLDWRIKTLGGPWSEEKIRKTVEIVSDLIEQYKPNVLVIKKLHPSRRTENLLRLTDKIKSIARCKDLKVYKYSIKYIEDHFIRDNKLNRRNLIKEIVKLYPILYHDLENEQRHRNQYYSRTFEAVALAAAHSQK